MNEEIIFRAGEIIERNTGEEAYCSLAPIDLDGYPTVSTITPSKADGINWLTFCTGLGGDKADRIKRCNRASVCINSNDFNITLVDTIDIITDQEVKEEMWYDGLVNHFSGPQIQTIVSCVSVRNATTSWLTGRKLKEAYRHK